METITRKYTIYQYNELSDKAKQAALESLYDVNVDHAWWESLYEDAENIGLQIHGFDIGCGYVNGEFIRDAHHTASRIVADHGAHCETYKTSENYLADYGALKMKYQASEEYKEYEDYGDMDTEDIDEEFLHSLQEDYRIILTHEYEYLTSEEAIVETIEANEYTFLEDGTLFN